MSDPRASSTPFGPEPNNMNSAPGFQPDNNDDILHPSHVSMSDLSHSSGTSDLYTPDSKMSADWPLPVGTRFHINDHSSHPDPPEADLDTNNVIDPTSTTFIATAIVMAIIILGRFYLARRPAAVDEASGMIARSIIEGMIQNVDRDVAVAKANCRKTQSKLKKARASLAAKRQTAEKEQELGAGLSDLFGLVFSMSEGEPQE
ncbi:hypothetical protein ACHAP5_010878 [Fusarium lateritium]